jgi:hypothetical protein
MANDANKATQELITIAGGVDLEVSYRDNHAAGAMEIVRVRQIPISKLSEFLSAMGNEARTIELYCDKAEGWADTLSLESATAVADKGQELNLPFLEAWWRRQAKWRKMQAVWTGSENVGQVPPKPSPSPSLPRQSPITTT